ncbi:MAG: flagellar motor protein MotD [Methylovulum sp.]|nr:flagellar motor protein MotD [Methylovulum sp.]
MDDAGNHDRWLVSYADFITLLFAFFVVMYSISSVNEAKYRSLSHSIGSAFSNKNQPNAANATDPVQLRTPSTVLQSIPLDAPVVSGQPVPPVDQPEEIDKKRQLSEEILKERKQLNQVSEQLKSALEPFIDMELVSVVSNDYWISLEMNSALLFLSGDAELSKKAMPVLKKIAEVINPMKNAINVEGHTDNVPISNVKFRSNWDLSSARASSVVQEFAKLGIDPARLSAIGYGEFHPMAENTTEEGRFKNRRVLLVLMSQAFSRYGASDEERAKLLNLEPTTPMEGAVENPPD